MTLTQTGGGQLDSTITRSITPYGQIGNEAMAFDGETTSFSQTWDGAGRLVSLESGMGTLPMLRYFSREWLGEHGRF